MLQILRKHAQSIVIQVIVVIIALVFIFWGVGTNMTNKQESAIVVNDEKISFQDFQQAYDQAYARLGQQFGGTIPRELAESLNIKQQVINQLTQEALLRQGAAEMGISVSGVEIQKEIEGMVQFQSEAGFDIERYKTILAANRMTPTKFEQSLLHDLLAGKTVDQLSRFALPPSEFEIKDLYELENETVAVSYSVISPQRYLADVEVNEAELEQWYQTAGEQYTTPAKIKLTYLPFEFRQTGSRITVDEAEIQAYYDQNLTQYQVPEKRHARHILLKAGPDDPEEIHQQQRTRAGEVLEKAKSGEDFGQLASQYSEGPTAPTGGDLGFFERGRMVQPFDEAVFAMQAGSISDIVQTDFGYHIIKLEEVQPPQIRPLAELRPEILQTLQLEQAKPLAFQLANDAYEKIISAGSLAAYLESEAAAEVVKTNFFSRLEPPAGMPSDPAFLERAFSLQQGELSSLVETKQGYAILSVDEVQQPEIPPLSEVRQQASEDYKQQKARDKARDVAEKLLAEFSSQQNASFESLVRSQDLEVQQSGRLKKNAQEQSGDFPQELVQAAFALSASEPVPAEPAQAGDDLYVMHFSDRTTPETAMSDAQRLQYKEMLTQYEQQLVLDAWLQNQQAQAEIFVSKSLENF